MIAHHRDLGNLNSLEQEVFHNVLQENIHVLPSIEGKNAFLLFLLRCPNTAKYNHGILVARERQSGCFAYLFGRDFPKALEIFSSTQSYNGNPRRPLKGLEHLESRHIEVIGHNDRHEKKFPFVSARGFMEGGEHLIKPQLFRMSYGLGKVFDIWANAGHNPMEDKLTLYWTVPKKRMRTPHEVYSFQRRGEFWTVKGNEDFKV